jgi:AhpD family alkylhydroperoxidase
MSIKNKRISIKDIEPSLQSNAGCESYVKNIAVTPILKELIKIRASQLNGCAYCVDMHTEHAIKLGESERRIFALPVWKESHLFTDEEEQFFN